MHTFVDMTNSQNFKIYMISQVKIWLYIKQWLEVKVEKEMEVARMHPAAVSFGAHPVPYAPMKVNINIFEIIEVDWYFPKET